MSCCHGNHGAGLTFLLVAEGAWSTSGGAGKGGGYTGRGCALLGAEEDGARVSEKRWGLVTHSGLLLLLSSQGFRIPTFPPGVKELPRWWLPRPLEPLRFLPCTSPSWASHRIELRVLWWPLAPCPASPPMAFPP